MGQGMNPAALMSGGMGAASSMMGAQAQAKGDYFQAVQEKQQFWEGMIKSVQTGTAMTQHLTSTLNNISAVKASSGAALGSPSGDAISNYTMALGNQDESRAVSNIQQEAMKHWEASTYYQNAGNDAIQAGGLSAMGSLLGGIGGFIPK
jgi:hypothetical protein